MTTKLAKPRLARRRFLAGAGGTAALAFPAIARAQGPILMRWQSSWPAKDILHEYALDFAKKVNDMTGGDLKIEMLSGGAAVPTFGLVDAVSKGALDGSVGLLNDQYVKHPAFALWSSGPAFGMDANALLAWHKYGGGRALLAKIHAALGVNVVAFLYGPMPTQALGWFNKRITRPEDFKGLRYRAVGMSIDLFSRMGAKVNALPAADIASAMDREPPVLDGAEFNNPTSDRALGLAGAAKVYMMQSYHQSAEQLAVLFNKAKFDALPPRLKAVIENATEAASADMSWKAIDRYSRDHAELQARDKVQTYRTPDIVLKKQLEAHDAVTAKHRGDPLFREVEQSQRQFAERVVRWSLDTNVSPRAAYDHYFARKPPARAPARKKRK